ncbi:MAG: ribonuclease HI [Planctomycetota bacterium]|jgi:ribonuclease HI|nr:ribonuclease HI [Planctomycetota bacterium]
MTKSVDKARPFVQIYADGACSGNPGPGGWGALLRAPAANVEKRLSGAEKNTTNNRMELMAVISTLEALNVPCTVEVVTDSRYIVDAFQKNWIRNWLRNGWKTASRQPVKNVELWKRLLDAAAPHQIAWTWIRGHAGHPENELADSLAVAARLEIENKSR